MRKVSRFPSLKRDADGKMLCRGCGGPITEKRRKTWCSDPCKKKHDPYHIKLALIERDRGCCVICGAETRAALDWYYYHSKWTQKPTAVRDEIYERCRKATKAEYDHITPFSEGGATVVENMRTLCRPCHKEVTARWRAAKARMTFPPASGCVAGTETPASSAVNVSCKRLHRARGGD